MLLIARADTQESSHFWHANRSSSYHRTPKSES